MGAMSMLHVDTPMYTLVTAQHPHPLGPIPIQQCSAAQVDIDSCRREQAEFATLSPNHPMVLPPILMASDLHHLHSFAIDGQYTTAISMGATRTFQISDIKSLSLDCSW